MFIVVFMVFVAAMWIGYEIRDPQGRWYDLFH